MVYKIFFLVVRGRARDDGKNPRSRDPTNKGETKTTDINILKQINILNAKPPTLAIIIKNNPNLSIKIDVKR